MHEFRHVEFTLVDAAHAQQPLVPVGAGKRANEHTAHLEHPEQDRAHRLVCTGAKIDPLEAHRSIWAEREARPEHELDVRAVDGGELGARVLDKLGPQLDRAVNRLLAQDLRRERGEVARA